MHKNTTSLRGNSCSYASNSFHWRDSIIGGKSCQLKEHVWVILAFVFGTIQCTDIPRRGRPQEDEPQSE